MGGKVPLGIHDMARCDMATTWAIDWPMLVPGMELEPDQRHLLDVAGIDVLDAVDVLKPQFLLVDDETFHLVGAHADVIQKDVDLRHIESRENVHFHAIVSQGACADQTDDEHERRDRPLHREDCRIHKSPSPNRQPDKCIFTYHFS